MSDKIKGTMLPSNFFCTFSIINKVHVCGYNHLYVKFSNKINVALSLLDFILLLHKNCSIILFVKCDRPGECSSEKSCWAKGPAIKAESSRGNGGMLPGKIVNITFSEMQFLRGNCKMFNCLKSLEFCAK